jgi:hypothetical protein
MHRDRSIIGVVINIVLQRRCASSLSGQSDMRLKWIAAARVIEVARQLSHRIKSERFNEFLEHPATCR